MKVTGWTIVLALACLLAVAAAPARAQSTDGAIGNRTGATAGIDTPATAPNQAGIHRNHAADSVLRGGAGAGLPPQSADVCVLFPDALGCPGSGGSGSGSGSGSGAALPPPIPFDPGGYHHVRVGTHDAPAAILTLKLSGASCVVTRNGNPPLPCGPTLAAGANPADYEAQIQTTISSGDTSDNSTSAWVNLTVGVESSVSSDHVFSCVGCGEVESFIGGSWIVRIRPVGSTSYTESSTWFTASSSVGGP